MWKIVSILAGLAHAALASASSAPSGTSTTTTAPFTVDTGVPTLTISTSTPSPTVPLSATLPSQVALPPVQAWCPSQIFCAGSLLQTVNIAELYSDPKTIVDKPTSKSAQQVLADFATYNLSTVTENDMVNFEDIDFLGEGLELEGVALTNFNPDPPFLANITDPLLSAWTQIVNSYWTQLIRATNYSSTCPDYTDGSCEGTFIPLNNSFVIPGGRFREQYYWDSYWIIQGLIQSQLYDIINSTLQNFMDEIEDFGFIPNGGRIYYLNRSQPPLFIHMVYDYVAATNDTSILARAIPSAEVELAWWQNNRTIQVTSPYTNQTYAMARYAVTNTAPRPESYITDYDTANDPTLPVLTEDERSVLYSELASGAETGWDYTSRFQTVPAYGNPGLRSLNVSNTIPICLNSILYKAHLLLADLYGSTNATAVSYHQQAAANIRAGILDLFWDPNKLAFYDFNLTSSTRNSIFTAATFYPLWNGIIPDEVLSSQENAFGFFSAINMVMNRYNGTHPTTFIDYTGLQWDAPNTWPPHQYIALEALRALPSNITSNPIPTPPANQSTYYLIPSGQLNLTEEELPGQPFRGLLAKTNASQTGPAADLNRLNGTVINGGNATEGEGWAQTLQREVANRYFSSALCSWHATGGSIPGYLPQLPASALNLSGSVGNTGNMYEKFSILNVDSSGSGGEYTVQAGFGWTNGAVLWVAATYGNLLVAPECPPLQNPNTTATNTSLIMSSMTSTATSSYSSTTGSSFSSSTTGTASSSSTSSSSTSTSDAAFGLVSLSETFATKLVLAVSVLALLLSA